MNGTNSKWYSYAVPQTVLFTKFISLASRTALLLFLVYNPVFLQAQCSLLGLPGRVIAEDFDDSTPPYDAEYELFGDVVGPLVTVTSGLVRVDICYWGDVGNTNETWTVTIAGESFSTGAFGYTPSEDDPACIPYFVSADAVESDLNDNGDISISYDNFGDGWTTDPATGTSDEFNAQVLFVLLDFDIDISVTSATSTCQDGDDIDFDGIPANGDVPGDNAYFDIIPFTDDFDRETGILDVSEIAPGTYTARYTYTIYGCQFRTTRTVEVFATPTATLEDYTLNCAAPGQVISLNLMFSDDNDPGGTFAIESGTGGSINGDRFTAPMEGGCFTISYTPPNPDNCSAVVSSEAELLINVRPDPALSVDLPAFICSTEDITVNVTNNSNGPNPVLTINDEEVDFGENTLAAPEEEGIIAYEICLTETTTPEDCGSITDSEDCSRIACETVRVFNNGAGCGADGPFLSECVPDPEAMDLCPIETQSFFDFTCGLIQIDPIPMGEESLDFSVIQAEITNVEPEIAFCDTEEICFDYQGSLPGEIGGIASGGPMIRDLSEAADAACTIINFTFSLPPPLEFVEIDPLPFPDVVEDACDKTIGEFVADAIANEVNADGGSGLIVADTDGDGAFDQVVEEYLFPGNGNACVPNNVQGAGVISIRNVVNFPFSTQSACGVPTTEGATLIDRLPIGSVPIIGGAISDALRIQGCDFPLDLSDEETVQIPVFNNSPPEFANCNSNGYTFSASSNCDNIANWSIPVAYDPCDNGILPYRGRTADTDASNFIGTPDAAVEITQSGLYQTAGPIPGSQLPGGDYEVTYTAYSCAGVEGSCTFPVTVSGGNTILALVCPDDVTVKTDFDVCTAQVTGIGILSGSDCNSIINYSIVFADGTTASSSTDFNDGNLGTVNSADGITFPLGESTVTYTLMIDLNGDGDADDTIDDVMETQTCTFTVTVVDGQRPDAFCIDVDVQLDNTGNVTVFAADQGDGSPFVDGGSTDNCDTDLEILIAKPGETFDISANFDCTETGYSLVTLQVTDDAGNTSTCLSQIHVQDFFDGIEFDLDLPELCLEANNPDQLDFSNYLVITLPDGTTLTHAEVVNNTYLGDAVGGFGLSVFSPAAGTTSTDPGTISSDGVFTPGDGTGYITVSYVLALPGAVVQNSNVGLNGCLEIVHSTFELRQPLAMEAPVCECIVQNDRVVNLGEVTGGLEPYTIQYGGVQLDLDRDGIADDTDGEFTYQGSIFSSNGTITFDITDFTQDLGNLLVNYTQPTWSFTILDARGCELFRSGSCDNDDENGTPEILCEDLGPVALTTEEFVCEAQHTWEHPLPTDNCDVIIYTYTITNPDGSVAGPFDITALLNPDITNPLPDQFFATYDFEHLSPTENVSTVTYYAEDAVGNFSQCSFEVTVTDDDAPRFINCPEPAVIVDAPPTWCSAYANYSLPLAEDNCDIPVVTQIDDTGLTSGDIYPVGITINTFEAIDATGNRTLCDVKIIVNDYHTPPSFVCPDDVTTANDFGDCGAVVDDIAPANIEDNCPDNLTVAYRIENEAGEEIANGLDDASDNFFELGTSTVTYSLQDMPLLLITEITHDLSDPVDGTVPVPPFSIGNAVDGDYLEITNFNSASLDVSCLMIERLSAAGSEIFAVPTGVILAPGGVLTIHFGDGTDSPADNFYNIPGAANLDADAPAAYIVSLSRSILDIAVLNDFDISGLAPLQYNLAGREIEDYWSGTISPLFGGGIIRTTVWDTNTAADFEPGEACLPTTIGMLNPSLPQPTPNGAQTAIQAQPITRLECSFTVTVTDAEMAICGLYGDYTEYPGNPETIAYGECVESVVTVDEFFTIADLNLSLAGDAGDFADLTFSLISPEGTLIELLIAECTGTSAFDFTLDGDSELAEPFLDNCASLNGGLTLVPTGNIEAFNGEQAQGDWTLQIGHNGTVTTDPATLATWSLLISAREAYDQMDVTLENDLNLCGAEYTYLQAILFDNCPGGSVQLTITFEGGAVELDQTLSIFPENTEFTYFFQVGETTVLYTLTDAAGNTSTCGFTVTVLDVQFPEITCPDDLVIQLGPGECETNQYPTTPIFEFDNCPDYVLSSFPPGTSVPIGDTTITLIITDASGNETTCTYNLTVLEFETDQALACINEQNVSLGADCQATITADMLLSGDLYRCYDNYIVTLYPDMPDTGAEPISTSPLITVDYVGETIVAEICDPDTGECCWGFVNVEYKLIPEFICPADTVVNCTDLTGPDLLGVPEVTSCVPGGAVVTHQDELTDNGACGEPRFVIMRTWTVADAVGNSAQCTQTIEVATFDLDQIMFPENYDGITNPVLDCSAVLADPTLTSPDNLGYPTINGTDLYEAIYCSAAINFNDETFYICDNSFLLFRTWRIVNQCLPNPLSDVREFTQIIRVEDSDGPDLSCPEDETISVSPFDCTATYQVPVLDILDACSDVTYIVQVDNDTLTSQSNNLYIVTGLERGDHTVTYLAQDACGIRSQCSFTVTVEDQIAPTASCNDELNVSIGGGDVANGLFGQSRILATDVDEGSRDNCSTVDLEVRRNYWHNDTCDPSENSWSPWGDFVDFYCCDINNEITIELRVTDAVGNQNTCWLTITPEDKLTPFCYAPDNMELTCNDLPLTFPGDIETAYDEDFAATSIMMSSIFGGATGTDNCVVDTIVERTPNIQINDCGWGSITRRFEAWQLRPEGDANGNGAIDINEV
ncbi:MAG: HYR domain-containing protein, partial [Lewinella sp.]|uniref:HYR domain-containing protein n=1 Tax=Lewinella sp. TaxID=2004506 RepID=UPI003D6A6783